MNAKFAPEEAVRYDAGLLSDYGGGNVGWWQDYIRAELERAHEFYTEALTQQPVAVDEVIERMRRGPDRLWQADLVGGKISIDRMHEILTAAFAQPPAADSRICRVCDGGPGNDGSCLCGHRRWE